MKKELAGRDPSLTKDIFEKIDKEVEKNRNRVK